MPINVTVMSSQMYENSSQIRDFSSTRSSKMAFTAEVVREELQSHIKDLAQTSLEPSVKGKLRDLARHIGLSAGRVSKYFYGEVPTPPAHEADQIRAYYEAAIDLIEARKAYAARRESFLTNYPRLARLYPPALKDTALTNEAAAVAASELARRK
jgi:hypothetical protein